jgi:hypothetical protein
VTAKESSITIGRSAFISPEVRYHSKREEGRAKREEEERIQLRPLLALPSSLLAS